MHLGSSSTGHYESLEESIIDLTLWYVSPQYDLNYTSRVTHCPCLYLSLIGDFTSDHKFSLLVRYITWVLGTLCVILQCIRLRRLEQTTGATTYVTSLTRALSIFIYFLAT